MVERAVTDREALHRLAQADEPLDAALSGLSRVVERSDSGPEEPFAAALVNSGAVRIDGTGPPPPPRPHL